METILEITITIKTPKSSSKLEDRVVEAKKYEYEYIHGHRYTVGLASFTITNMLCKGSSMVEMVQALMEKHDFNNEAKAKTKIRGHMGWLRKQEGVVVVENDGIYKAEVETVEG